MVDAESGFDLIQKYNVSGPRYTSYPTAMQFAETGRRGTERYMRYLRRWNDEPRDISLYFHIPFCFSLCWYCGCTKVISKDQGRGDHYIDCLEKEMDLYATKLHPDSKVVQIHFGGGTPTFLEPEQIERLGRAVNSRFAYDDNMEFSVEIDPRSCSRRKIESLKKIGCNRASLGVQDTNREVQEAIHRDQPFELTRITTEWLREEGVGSVNFDLVYGLPRQTPERFGKTLSDVLTLGPDRLAVYSYAHVPHLMPSQRLIDTADLPSTEDKLKMLKMAVARLKQTGYRYIGMDHFALESDTLTEALDNGSLRRNFQGYSTRSESDIYAFGMSGISQVGSWYVQNSKELNSYYESLEKGDAPIVKALELSRDDLIRRDLIMQVMCRTVIDFQELEKRWDLLMDSYFEKELERLERLEMDGLIEIGPASLRITATGRLFLRNIAMEFDRYLKEKKHKPVYSKTI